MDYACTCSQHWTEPYVSHDREVSRPECYWEDSLDVQGVCILLDRAHQVRICPKALGFLHTILTLFSRRITDFLPL